LGMPMHKITDLDEQGAKKDLEELQKKYGALVVTFNNQQAELAAAQRSLEKLEDENAMLKSQAAAGGALSSDEMTKQLQDQLEKQASEIRALEGSNMVLQKKVNKLQVEHVSEEEVDQLFYALEKKEQELDIANRDKANLEQEIVSARGMLSARGTVEPKYVEIHHHNDASDSEDEEKPNPVS